MRGGVVALGLQSGCMNLSGAGILAFANPIWRRNSLYPNLSQLAANCAQTVQREPNAIYCYHQLRPEPERNHPS